MKGDTVMRDYTSGYTPQTSFIDKQERYVLLATQLEVSANRICDYQDQLIASAATIKPIELERLMDDYRAEQIRYDRIDRELQSFETPVRTAAVKERWRKQNRDRKKKIHY